jgi:hypothetical protein
MRAAQATLLTAALLLQACGLSVTNERPSYDELDPVEKGAVDTILQELTQFNAQVAQRTKYDISEILDREKIHVSFEGLIFSANLGDQVIHVSVWENIGRAKQSLIQSWFKAQTPTKAKAIYVKLFYQFLAVSQGAKQFMYKVLSADWVYHHRSIFNVEKDSIRTALSHYVAVGRKQEMWGFLKGACSPVLSQYAAEFSSKFDKTYLQQHFTEIFDPEDPTGYMYFVCRWIELGMLEAEGLNGELTWLIDLPS